VLTFNLIVLIKEIPAYLLTGRKYKEPAYKVRTSWFQESIKLKCT